MVVRPKIALGIVVSLILYLRGWFVLHRTLPVRFPVWRLLRFRGGLGGALDRNCLAARCVLRLAAFGPYGATFVAHVRRPAADSARRAASSAAARAAKEIRARRSGPLSYLAGACAGLGMR